MKIRSGSCFLIKYFKYTETYHYRPNIGLKLDFLVFRKATDSLHMYKVRFRQKVAIVVLILLTWII